MRSVKSTPQGFTLIEITFSIAFLTMMLASVTAGFVGIFGLYNQAQGLGRTSQAARDSIETLADDLRQTSKVEYWPHGMDVNKTDEFRYEGNTLVNANPRKLPIVAGDSLRGKVKDFYCLSNDTRQIGYALLFTTSTGKYTLARFSGTTGSSGCTKPSAKVDYLTEGDLWSDAGSGTPSITTGELPGRSPADSKNYRPFVISRMNKDSSAAPVWQVKVAVHRGSRIPGVTSDLISDQFSAETTLQALVGSRR